MRSRVSRTGFGGAVRSYWSRPRVSSSRSMMRLKGRAPEGSESSGSGVVVPGSTKAATMSGVPSCVVFSQTAGASITSSSARMVPWSRAPQERLMEARSRVIRGSSSGPWSATDFKATSPRKRERSRAPQVSVPGMRVLICRARKSWAGAVVIQIRPATSSRASRVKITPRVHAVVLYGRCPSILFTDPPRQIQVIDCNPS